MTPFLMYTDTNHSNNHIRQAKIHLEDLNEILNDYKLLNLPEITGPEFQKLIHNPKSVVFDKMNSGASLELNGMPIDRAKAVDLVTMPDGFDSLNQIIESFKRNRSGWNHLLTNIDIDETGVILKQTVIDAHVNSSKIYATTVEEKALFDFLTAVVSAATTAFGTKRYDLADLIGKRIILDNTPGSAPSYKILYKEIKGFGGPY